MSPDGWTEPPRKRPSWIRENSTLIYFLIAQMVAIGAGGASMLAYFTKLETRVSTMEERGAAYTVSRMDEMKLKIAVLEQQIEKNEQSIQRLVEQYLKSNPPSRQ
jgi:uncharacterized coiled-coil protein SlyX